MNKHKQILWKVLIQHLSNCKPFFDMELEILSSKDEDKKQRTKRTLYRVWIYDELI